MMYIYWYAALEVAGRRLVDGRNFRENCVLRAWDAATDRIPILGTPTVAQCGIEDKRAF